MQFLTFWIVSDLPNPQAAIVEWGIQSHLRSTRDDVRKVYEANKQRTIQACSRLYRT